jgi:hypothetical protein
MNKHKTALSYAIKSANRWKALFLYYQVSIFYKIKGQKQKSDDYFEIAVSLAKKEEQLRPKKTNSTH